MGILVNLQDGGTAEIDIGMIQRPILPPKKFIKIESLRFFGEKIFIVEEEGEFQIISHFADEGSCAENITDEVLDSLRVPYNFSFSEIYQFIFKLNNTSQEETYS